MSSDSSRRHVAELQKAESDFLTMFPRSMIESENAYKKWLSVAIKKWPLDMQERIANMRAAITQAEISNVDVRIKAVARYCWKRLKDDYPEYVAGDGIFR